MKIGKFDIVGGPNWAFWAITLLAIYAAVSEGSWTPVWLWLGFVVMSALIGYAAVKLHGDWPPPTSGP